MVARELGVGLAVVIFIAILEWIVSPSVHWILCDRRNPDGGDTQLVEESLFDFLCDTCDVATLIIYNIQDFRAVHLPIVVFIAVLEAVDHEGIEHLCMVIVTSELSHIVHHFTILQWNEQVVEVLAIAQSIYANECATFALAPCFFDCDSGFWIILTVANIFRSAGILPEDTELQVFIFVEYTNGDGGVGKGFSNESNFVV